MNKRSLKRKLAAMSPEKTAFEHPDFPYVEKGKLYHWKSEEAYRESRELLATATSLETAYDDIGTAMKAYADFRKENAVRDPDMPTPAQEVKKYSHLLNYKSEPAQQKTEDELQSEADIKNKKAASVRRQKSRGVAHEN